jgi:hypothetical protein
MKVTGKRSVASYLIVLLNIGRYGLAVTLTVTVVVVVLSLFTAMPGLEMSPVPPSFGVETNRSGWTMTIPVSLTMPEPQSAVAPSLGIKGAELRDLRGSLRFPTRRGAFFMANAVLLVTVLALTLWITSQLLAVLRSVRDGHPFVPQNATRVRWVAWAVIGGELGRAAVVFFENYYAMQHFSAEGIQFSARPQLDVFAIGAGLIILVIAEVFRAGSRLDEDQSLTV